MSSLYSLHRGKTEVQTGLSNLPILAGLKHIPRFPLKIGSLTLTPNTFMGQKGQFSPLADTEYK